jgi:SAM-dependent methyltransferase
MLRFGPSFSGRVLEVGCGAGRVLGYLCELSPEVYGLDISPTMVEHCRRTYPDADVQLADMRDVSLYPARPLSLVLLSYNLLDILAPDERRRLLSEIRPRLGPEGLLIFSSHNRDAHDEMPWIGEHVRKRLPTSKAEARRRAGRMLDVSPYRLVRTIASLPTRRRNQRRLRPLELHTPEYALINDPLHDYSQLFYYVNRDNQARQLAETGYELVQCLDLDGHVVPAGARSPSPELHYVARPSS